MVRAPGLAAPAPTDAPRVGVRRWRITTRRGCWVVGLVSAAVGAVGVWGRARGVLVLPRLTDHFAAALIVAVVLFFVGVLLLSPRGRLGRVLVDLLAVALVLALPAVYQLYLLLDGGDRSVARHVSPNGRLVLVVTRSSWSLDPVWLVTVRESSPWLARTWHVACVNGDADEGRLGGARWITPTEIEVVTAARAHRISVDAADGHPASVLSTGCALDEPPSR